MYDFFIGVISTLFLESIVIVILMIYRKKKYQKSDFSIYKLEFPFSEKKLKEDINKTILEFEKYHNIKYTKVVNLDEISNSLDYFGDLFVIVPKANIYNLEVKKLEINEDYIENKSNSDFLLETESVFKLKKLNLETSVAFYLNLSSIPSFSLQWEDEYGDKGKYIFSKQGYNDVYSTNINDYESNKMSIIRQKLGIRKHK